MSIYILHIIFEHSGVKYVVCMYLCRVFFKGFSRPKRFVCSGLKFVTIKWRIFRNNWALVSVEIHLIWYEFKTRSQSTRTCKSQLYNMVNLLWIFNLMLNIFLCFTHLGEIKWKRFILIWKGFLCILLVSIQYIRMFRLRWIICWEVIIHTI